MAEEYSLRGWKDEPFFLERAGNRYLRKITDLYIQRMENGVTYTVIDPNEDLFYIGTVEDRISEFNQYGDNAYVPRTVYHSRGSCAAATLAMSIRRSCGPEVSMSS